MNHVHYTCSLRVKAWVKKPHKERIPCCICDPHKRCINDKHQGKTLVQRLKSWFNSFRQGRGE